MKSQTQRPPLPPLIVILFGFVAISSASIFIRYAQESAPSLVIAAYRLSLATLVLAPFTLIKQRAELLALTNRQRLLAIISGLFLAIHFATWITSLAYTTVASSVVLVSTSPLWVALLSHLVIKEPISRPVLIGLFLALVGGITVGISEACSFTNGLISCQPIDDLIRGRAFWGNILALIGAWGVTGYLLIGRQLRVKMGLVSYIFLVYAVAAAVLIITMFLAGHSPWGYQREVYIWMLLLALVPQLLGHSSFNWALRYLSAVYVSITLLSEPIGSTILAYILLEEKPTIIMVFGAILILSGIYIASRSDAWGRYQKEGTRKVE
ncbi:MAG: DMT family transporter [Anaerolineales bacterium]|nr:DMT family transporter [Anaerolineales bacterium]